MEMTMDEQAAFLCDMEDYARLFSRRIMAGKRLPADYHLAESDIIHEVNLAFLRIARTFRPKAGGRSLRSYCYKYGEKCALNEIWKTYRAIRGRLDAIPIEEAGEKIHRQYGRYDFEPRKGLMETIEVSDVIDNLCLMADEMERRIMTLIRSGYSEREAAQKVGMTQPALRKRMLRLGRRFKVWEDKPLG